MGKMSDSQSLKRNHNRLGMDKPLINTTYQLEKFNGKGGWTYAEP